MNTWGDAVNDNLGALDALEKELSFNPLTTFVKALRLGTPLRLRIHLRNYPNAHSARTRLIKRAALARLRRGALGG